MGATGSLSSLFSKRFKDSGIDTFVFSRDYEHWGEKRFEPKELMRLALDAMGTCDAVIIEFSEKGVGLGIEAGYAYAKGKPIHVVARVGSEISDTLRGIADSVTFYESPETLDMKALRG